MPPVQLSLLDWLAAAARSSRNTPPSAFLTAMIDNAGVGHRPARDVARVEAAIAANLPAGVPSFASEILSARRTDDAVLGRVRLFDGGVLLLTVSLDGEPTVTAWQTEGDERPFHCVDGAWTRFDEPVPTPPARPSLEDVAFVEAAIRHSLPEGYPSYATEILRVRRTGGQIFVRIKFWDGEPALLRLKGDPPDGDFGWRIHARDGFTLGFDEETWTWIRIRGADG